MRALPYGPLDPFPFYDHRTLAAVTRTLELRAISAFRILTAKEEQEIQRLLKKATQFNPPPSDTGNAAA